MSLKIIVGCESSGVVRDEFAKLGHDAWSCDLLPCERGGKHIQGDILNVLDEGWDMGIFFPPCTYLTVTGNKWMLPKYADRFPDRKQQRQEAIEFFMKLANCKIPLRSNENPVGIMSTEWRKPDQIVHPYYFGDPHSKKTCLWLHNLPLLKPTQMVEPKFYIYKDGRRDPLWHYETMHLPKHERMVERSRTFTGFAKAMASQWGNIKMPKRVWSLYVPPLFA